MKMQGNIARMAMHEVDNVRRKVAQYKMKSETTEVSRAELLKELENTKHHMSELKVKLDKAEAEESKLKEELNRMKHYLEIGELFAREGGESEQLDKVETQREAAVSELHSVKEEIKALKEECTALVKVRENMVAKVEEAVLTSKNAERMVEELAEELVNARKSLEIATMEKQEAEENNVSASLAKDEECHKWKKEIREAEEELLQLSMQVTSAKELGGKLEVTTSLLEKLNAELEIYVQKLDPENNGIHNEEHRKKQEMLDSKTKELENVKGRVGKVQGEIDVLRVEVSSLKTEIDKEKTELAKLQQKGELASVEIPSIRTEIEKTKEKIDACIGKEKEATRKIDELPTLIEEATLEVKRSKSIAQDAEAELNNVKAETEPVLVRFKTIMMKVIASRKEIEASKMSENVSLTAIKALQESETDISEKVTISLDEYFDLSKQGHEAAEQAQARLDAVVAEIETAKVSATNSYAVLCKVYNELDGKKKVLYETTQRGIRAAERKMDAEQELKHLKEMSEEQCNGVELHKNEVSEPADEVAKADIKVIKPDVATNGDTETDDDYKEEVKLDEAVIGIPTTSEPNKGELDRSNLDDSFHETNRCCLSGRRSFLSDDGATTEYQSLVDSPMGTAGKKKRNFFRKFWAKRNAQSVAG
jgi:chromosome segregation ATPase